jgi:hypothetical protein
MTTVMLRNAVDAARDVVTPTLDMSPKEKPPCHCQVWYTRNGPP